MRIRDACAGDHELFRRFYSELGIPEAPPDVQHWTSELVPGSFFIEDNGLTLAYAAAFPRGEAGHVLHVVVGPEHRRLGLGEMLMLEASQRLRTAGCRRWFLNVREENTGAIALYRKLGLWPAHSARALRLDARLLGILPADPAVLARILTDAEARAAEAKYTLYEGAANRPPGMGLGAWREGELCGAARFVPAMARAAPFRIDDRGVVRPLCDAMRAMLPEAPFLRVVLEAQPKLADWLVELGAVEELRLCHLVGELPVP